MTATEKLIIAGASALAIGVAYYLKAPWIIPTSIVISAVLLVTFLEFEKSYDSTRIISLLAFITAFTIVSRQMLHGIDVSPVFFIVMLTGYVFGPVSGFVVGATTMFVSNFFVGGHGPWTPFQMTALGLTGVGAALLPHQKHARLRLLILCVYAFFSAFFYSAVTDIFWWMTFTREQTLKTYLAVSATGIIFSVARAVGSILLTIFFGPALIKVFARFKSRFLVEYVD